MGKALTLSHPLITGINLLTFTKIKQLILQLIKLYLKCNLYEQALEIYLLEYKFADALQ